VPVEPIELIKLIGGIFIFIIPGYLWSFMFFKDLNRLERVVFGFVLTTCMFVLAFFTFDIVLNIPITQNKTVLLYAVYTGAIFFLFFV